MRPAEGSETRPFAADRPRRALMLAAGLGSRLGRERPVPKALLEFGGRSLLARHVDLLAALGVDELTLGVGYRSRLVREAIAALSPRLEVRFVVLDALCVHIEPDPSASSSSLPPPRLSWRNFGDVEHDRDGCARKLIREMRSSFRQRLNHALGENQEFETESVHVELFVIKRHARGSAQPDDGLPTFS
jgi:hypothetical protein